MRYYDAHLHLQDPRLNDHQSQILAETKAKGIVECVVNGTGPCDWEQVSRLSNNTVVRPAFGLHPWNVATAPDDWFEKLQTLLNTHDGALVGEIGLDKWIKEPQFEKQLIAFEKQIKLAAALDLPPTIHCLKAWGPMLTLLEKNHHLLPGFLLHSYSGPTEMVDVFVEMGAYFSISGQFANPEKVKKLEPWKRVPIERILVETDAPDMLPPENLRINHLADSNEKPLNHPHNLGSIYKWAASFFGFEFEAFVLQIEKNYRRLFGTK